jgi:hypothetical protein
MFVCVVTKLFDTGLGLVRFGLVFYLDICIGDLDEFAKSLSTKKFVFRRFESLPPPCSRTSTLDYD